ncbi:Translation initiation factor 1A [uncultured archaeon]|nr:Translation initiation factor 1A [uncultured archaeon]
MNYRGVILKERAKSGPAPDEFTRVRIPQKGANEVLGIVESLLGANKIRVRCMDGVVRLARIPGKIKKKIWIMEGDVVIVVPWSFQNEKADIAWKYSGPQVNWLQRKGFLKS